MNLDYLDVLLKIAAPLLRPNTFTSLNQLAKRVRLPEDQVTRAIARLASWFQCELIVKHNRRLVLTERGERIVRIADQLFAVTTTDCDDTPEVLAVDVEPALTEAILPTSLGDFLSAWGGLVALRIGRLDPDPVVRQERLTNGTISFALGFSDGESSSTTEVLEPAIPWVTVLPANHALDSAVNGLSPAVLGRMDRVFVPGDERSLAALAGVLPAIPPVHRIECESAAVVRAMVSAGLGVGLELDSGRLRAPRHDGLHRVPLLGTKTESIALFFPRKAHPLSEAAQSLATAIKRAVAAPPAPLPESVPEEASSDAELTVV